MVLSIFAFVFVCYCVLSAVAYMPSIKNSWYYYLLGLGISTVVNLLWLYLAKITIDVREINKYSYIWDGIIIVTAALIPILFFGVVPKGSHLLGIVMILVGIIILKVA